LDQKNKVFITLHQEDERIKGVDLVRPNIDIGIVLLRKTQQGIELIDLKDFTDARQVELEVTLSPGSYLILPRTTGCKMAWPSEGATDVKLLTEKIAENTLTRRLKSI
jgi:hypothetical protein